MADLKGQQRVMGVSSAKGERTSASGTEEVFRIPDAAFAVKRQPSIPLHRRFGLPRPRADGVDPTQLGRPSPVSVEGTSTLFGLAAYALPMLPPDDIDARAAAILEAIGETDCPPQPVVKVKMPPPSPCSRAFRERAPVPLNAVAAMVGSGLLKPELLPLLGLVALAPGIIVGSARLRWHPDAAPARLPVPERPPRHARPCRSRAPASVTHCGPPGWLAAPTLLEQRRRHCPPRRPAGLVAARVMPRRSSLAALRHRASGHALRLRGACRRAPTAISCRRGAGSRPPSTANTGSSTLPRETPPRSPPSPLPPTR